MKKLILFGLLTGLLLMRTSAQANTPKTTPTTQRKPPSSMIDGIEVPFEVLDYAQMKYQGFAVTQVRKTYHGNKQVYRLRVDRDDIPDDYDSIILLYSLKWKLIGDEKMVAPPAPRYVPRQPEVIKEPTKPDSQERPEKPRHQKPDKPAQRQEEPDELDESEWLEDEYDYEYEYDDEPDYIRNRHMR